MSTCWAQYASFFCSNPSRSAVRRATSSVGCRGTSGSGGPDGPRKVRQRVRVQKRRRDGRQGRRFIPGTALQRIARRNGGERVVTCDRRRRVHRCSRDPWRERGHLLDDLASGPILPGLQVRIHLVVERVELLGDRLVPARGLGRGQVGVDRVLPVPDACERVRGHVQRMRRRRRDLRVARGGVERLWGERGDVVAVNQVVGQARMIRLRLEERLEDRAGGQLVLVSLVAGQRRLGQRQRVEHGRFGVLGVAAGHRFHLLCVRERARALINRFVVAKELGHGGHVSPLPG